MDIEEKRHFYPRRKCDIILYPKRNGVWVMLGAVVGDIVGSKYEDHPIKTKKFPLFGEGCTFTDDTVMTVAVAEALMNTMGMGPKEVRAEVIKKLRYWGRKYPKAGYGKRFIFWLAEPFPKPYHSWGNGSAMRVSPAGWLYAAIRQTADHARYSAEVTHDHPEGIKGAEAVASAVFMLRQGKSKNEVKSYIRGVYGYDFRFTLDEIRPGYGFDVSCQGSVPQAFVSFFESHDFESCLRNAVSLGGDSDTLAAMAGSLGEACYGIPDEIRKKTLSYLDDEMVAVYNKFSEMRR